MGPEERVLKALEDVQDCASFVISAAEGRDLDDYRGDRLFRQAVERNLEIIGEAIGRIARLDDELVWSTVENEVPVLLLEVEGLLREKGP